MTAYRARGVGSKVGRGAAEAPPEYQPFYCEENVWRACRGEAGSKVLFLTNRRRAVLMRHQRAVPPGEPVWWDYHVVRVRPGPPAAIVDLDTRLVPPGAALPASEWLARSLPSRDLPPGLEPLFRLVDAADYSRRLWSDRSHMRAGSRGWLAPPPPWDPPLPPREAEPVPLGRYLDLDDGALGPWLGRGALEAVLERLPGLRA